MESKLMPCKYCNYLPCVFKPRHWWKQWHVWMCKCNRPSDVYGWSKKAAIRKWNKSMMQEERQ